MHEDLRREATWSLVLTTHKGFVTMVVVAPAAEAATILAPIDSPPP